MIINCKECGREISDTAKQCPHCGAKVKKEKVKKKEDQQDNIFNRIADIVSGSVKAIRIYLGVLIASCAIALCFFILTILSYATPYAFLHSEPCKDGYALVNELVINDQNQFIIRNNRYTISRGKFGNSIMISVSSNILGASGQVQYQFENNGSITAYAFYNGYECVYNVKRTEAVFVEAFYKYKPTTLSTADRELADSSIELAEAVFDYVLTSNNKDYEFYDILNDYADYKTSVSGIRISSIVLMSVFAVVSVCGIVFYVKFIRKKGKTSIPQSDEINVNNAVNETNDNAVDVVDLENIKSKQKSPYYICDCCKQKIDHLSDATLQWKQPFNNDDNLGNSAGEFKIVHRMCLEDGFAISDMDFNDNYENAVMRILELLSDNCVANPEEAYEILKRLTITDYEIVRPFIDSAIADDVIEPNSKINYLSCNQIIAIRKHYIDRK